MSQFTENNPLLASFTRFGGLPPFDEVKSVHYKPAFDHAMRCHLEELKSIAECPEPPTFQNTIEAFDKCGGELMKVGKVFYNLCASHCPPELQAVQTEMAAPLAQHKSATYMYPGLFARIDRVYEARSNAGYSPEQQRLVERIHLDFVRAGARFDAAAQARYKTIMTELAEVTTLFQQHILGDESNFTIDLGLDDLTGCPDFVIAGARQAAIERNKAEGVYVITLSRSSVEPFLTFSDRRDLREQAWRAWTTRGELDPTRDCRPLALQILAKRVEQASMHGYENYAAYATADTMAKTPDAVMELLEKVWPMAKQSADRERQALETFAKEHDGSNGEIEAWDWRYYAEKVRKAKYDLSKEELMPYFSLDRMVEAVFDCANQLFGLKFVHRPDLVSYHPDVKTYEVRETVNGQDKLVGLFLHDNFLRQHKKSGAWMSDYRSQSRTGSTDGSSVTPIIVNNNNFAKASEGATLISFDDATTLFHEFGHGMHGMLSDVTYERLAGTSVLRDFVELPSQLFEHWLSQPVVLKKWARHYQTGEPIPDELLKRLIAAKCFNKGFETVEYTISALIDQSIHKLTGQEIASLDLNAFEQKELARLGMPKGVIMRHRLPHFAHIFSGSSYASAYYVYLWAEVLDADGFEAFLETGNPFDQEVAKKVRKYIYSSGNSLDPREAFRLFRGRDPVVEPMLKKKGLLENSTN